MENLLKKTALKYRKEIVMRPLDLCGTLERGARKYFSPAFLTVGKTPHKVFSMNVSKHHRRGCPGNYFVTTNRL